MTFNVALKEIRQHLFLSQKSFASEIGVSFCSVNRWENGKSIPNYQAMKKITAYCVERQVDCAALEQLWKENINGSHTC